jgi:hypothetical protein
MRRSKEVEGLLLKTAELETFLILLIGLLEAKGHLTPEELQVMLGVVQMPEILAARIKSIEEQGSSLMEARKTLLSETLGLTPPLVLKENRKEKDLCPTT